MFGQQGATVAPVVFTIIVPRHDRDVWHLRKLTFDEEFIFAPLVAGLLAAIGTPRGGSDLAVAVPVVLGILLSYLVGGYIAGRMAGYRTSWHGLMTAFFSLLILLLALLVGALADRGVFAGSGVRSLADIVPGVRDLNIDSFGNALSFGAILGFLAAIFGGWLGGLLAPTQRAVVGAAPLRATPATTRDRVLGGRVVRDREVVRDRGTVGEPVRSERERAADSGVPGHGHLLPGGEDSHSHVSLLLGRQDERALGEVHLLGHLQHRRGLEALRLGKHRELITLEGVVGEDVQVQVSVLTHTDDPRRASGLKPEH